MLGSAGSLGATCVAEPARVVELEPIACRPALVAVEELAAGSPVWWLQEYMTSIARQVPGVLVRGKVARFRRYEPPQTLGPWQSGTGDEELFYPTLDPELCATFAPLDSVLLVCDLPCCEVIPPVDVACLLELPQARAPTPLERELAELERPE